MQRDPADCVSNCRSDESGPRCSHGGSRDWLLRSFDIPRWRLGFRETPVLAGTLLGLGVITAQVMLVFGCFTIWEKVRLYCD